MSYEFSSPQMRKGIIALFLFLCSLFLITALTLPGLQINDEWITANQLHQLIEGHQVLTSEGKYGSYFGEISPYFAGRNNILGYSLALPLLASGSMILFMVLGDYFRLGIIFFWALIPVICALILHVFFPAYDRWMRIPVIFPAMGFSLLLLWINLFLYLPFRSSIAEYPLESAALVFTAHILFGVLSVVLFYIGQELFSDTRKALFVAISLIACSSFLYWGTSGKDHMLSIVLISISMLFFCRYCSLHSRLPAILGFFFLGLTTWVRPELGITLFFTIGFFFVAETLIASFKQWHAINFFSRLTPFFGFLAGLIPFFLNNYILTGNPIFSPFLAYLPGKETGLNTGTISGAITYEGTVSVQSLGTGFSLDHLFSFISRYYVLSTPSFFDDINGIFFFADNGSMTVAALSPLLCIGILSIFFLLLRWVRISPRDFSILFLCFCVIFGIFMAYMRSFHGLHTSGGITPDIRYLAPMYIPGGIIGLIGMKYWKFCPIDAGLWKKSIIFILIGAPILLIGMLFIQPFGGGFFYYNYALSLCSFGFLFLLIIQYLIMEVFGRWNTWAIRGNLLLLLVVPIAWQLMMVFLFSIAKFDGYSFWIPMSNIIVNNFIGTVT